MYITCVILCLFSALSRRVGALQISVIIIKMLWNDDHRVSVTFSPLCHRGLMRSGPRDCSESRGTGRSGFFIRSFVDYSLINLLSIIVGQWGTKCSKCRVWDWVASLFAVLLFVSPFFFFLFFLFMNHCRKFVALNDCIALTQQRPSLWYDARQI